MVMKAKFFIASFVLIFAVSFGVFGQDISGLWKTIDDETGKAKSVVEIYKGGDGKFYGKITKLFREPGEEQNPKCDECSGSKKNQPIIGMIIITGMEKTKTNMWKNGEILDPGNGNVYDCKMWIEGKNLQVRGYLGLSMLGRSQTWLPYK
jgi:uncharacterized protein (DUF2147 family)